MSLLSCCAQCRPRAGLLFESMATCPYVSPVRNFLSSQDMEGRGKVLGQVWFFNFPTKWRVKLVLKESTTALRSYVILSKPHDLSRSVFFTAKGRC